MKRRAGTDASKSRRVKPWVYLTVLFVNLLVFACIGWIYYSSNRFYSERLFSENLKNVENLNAASANAAYTYAVGMGTKIDDIVRFVEADGALYEKAVSYLSVANSDPDRRLQLVLCDNADEYSGYSFRTVRNGDGSLDTIRTEIRYGSGYDEVRQSFLDANAGIGQGVSFAPEFTDPDTKRKCFAAYRHIALADGEGRESIYALLLAVDSETAMSAFDAQSEYAGQSAVLVNADGDYIIKNSEYRNVNFYDYIVNYNDLSSERREELQRDILENASDAGSSVNLFYANHRGADCVFAVAAMENGWHSITCVPLSSFTALTAEAGELDYSLIILVVFAALFCVDGLTFALIGRAMRYNVAVAERATREANEANRAKSRFLSAMSHELRTPLNAIIGLAALCGDSVGEPAVLKEYLKKIDISSKLLLQLISDILDVSAIESDKMRLNVGEFDVTKLITSLSAIYYEQCAAKGIEFSVALKNMRRETLIGDSVRVNQVLLNFLSNAVKFTPDGGRVTLCAEQTGGTKDSVVIRFTVSDTGCGVSEETKTRLFKPFERATGDTARKFSGTGLGLSIAKNLAELMKGSVGMQSKEGEGSSFWAEIPFGLPAEASGKSFSPIENMRVLAAIADADEREYIGQMLSGFGVERVLADGGETALSLLSERSGGEKPFTLCILDWKLADRSGSDIAKRIRAAYGGKGPRVMLLAYNLAEAGAQMADSGADRVLGKPVFPSALYNALEEISANRLRAAPSLEREYDLKGKRVLLVEDNRLNTEIARLLLRKVGVEVETAENGKLGMDCFAQSAPGHFDAILMDVQMPVMDGYQATAGIRACAHPQAKSIPILAMTADAFTEDVEMARAAGMNEHISKPVVPDTLYTVLKKYV